MRTNEAKVGRPPLNVHTRAAVFNRDRPGRRPERFTVDFNSFYANRAAAELDIKAQAMEHAHHQGLTFVTLQGEDG